MTRTILGSILMILGLASVAAAQPTQVSYQGELLVQGVPYDGGASFKFVILNPATFEALWSNDGSTADGSEPANWVDVAVDEGIFTVILGASPMLPLTSFDLQGVPQALLRVWVDTGSGFEQLSDQALSSAAFALHSETADGALGNFEVPGNVTAHGGITFADGNIQTKAGLTGYEVVTELTASTVNDLKSLVAECPAGKIAIGGGVRIFGSINGLAITANGPEGTPDMPTTWFGVGLRVDPNTSTNWGLRVDCFCVDAPPGAPRLAQVTSTVISVEEYEVGSGLE